MDIGLLGYGEVGEALADRFVANDCSVTVTTRSPDTLRDRIGPDGPTVVDSPVTVAERSDIVIACIWPETALEVSEAAAPGLAGTTYIDVNSIGPTTARRINAVVTDAEGVFLNGTIMGSVAEAGADAPLLLAGSAAGDYSDRLAENGLTVSVFSPDPEALAALKICRSIVTKGIMALYIEALATAQQYGVEERVLNSLHDSFHDKTPSEFVRYHLPRMPTHAARRTGELSEAIETTRDAHVQPTMTPKIQEMHHLITDLDSDVSSYADLVDAYRSEMAERNQVSSTD